MQERIQRLRKKLGLSQSEFGAKLGISGPAISKIESGVNTPADSTIKLICATYHVHYLWLTTGEGPIYETASGDELIDKYAPDADDHLKKVFREMAGLPDNAWLALRDYMNYMINAVDQARADQERSDES